MGSNCPSQSAHPLGGNPNEKMRISERKGSAIVSPFTLTHCSAGPVSEHYMIRTFAANLKRQLSTDSGPTLRYGDYRTTVMLLAVGRLYPQAHPEVNAAA